MKKPTNYPSVNAMLRGTMSREEADVLIDQMTELRVRENLDLLDALIALLKVCVANSSNGVCVSDKRVVAKARRIAVKYGAIIT